jgi:hypothetical protein
MYDLTSRIVDAESLPLNFVIVSSWARTGWNVIKPNLLIDATATRDVTAWQQLRGRAIRARRTWSNDCYRLLTVLTGHHLPSEDSAEHGAVDDLSELDDELLAILAEIASPTRYEALTRMPGTALTVEDRQALAVSLLEHRNKITHIYELVKAYGSGIQVTYNRTEKLWQRKEYIAQKHRGEISVHPFTGEKVEGVAHTPFIYVNDPRTDVPADLQQHLTNTIAGCDVTILKGWLGRNAAKEI